mmetsp:Transcript_39530/g.60356  ORF Transcript_39530/g.60356 Transcript_39530/m.60356 type:complete len:99 (-) Transcript_39530:553-849(-)
MKSSLLKKSGSVRIRADLADCGLYIISHSMFKTISHIHEKGEYNWLDFSEDTLPFLARNQFKQALSKLMDEANKDKNYSKRDQLEKEASERIAIMMGS